MFCKKCGESLPEDSLKCPKCNAECEGVISTKTVVVPPTAPKPVPVEGSPSGQAIAAFVLGLCSLLCWCLTGIPAIIVGKMSLNAIARGEADKSGKVFSLIGFIMGIVMTSFSVLYLLVMGFMILIGAFTGK